MSWDRREPKLLTSQWPGDTVRSKKRPRSQGCFQWYTSNHLQNLHPLRLYPLRVLPTPNNSKGQTFGTSAFGEHSRSDHITGFRTLRRVGFQSVRDSPSPASTYSASVCIRLWAPVMGGAQLWIRCLLGTIYLHPHQNSSMQVCLKAGAGHLCLCIGPRGFWNTECSLAQGSNFPCSKNRDHLLCQGG